MKYTSYLIKGNHLQCEQFTPKNKIGMKLWVIVVISFSICMLMFCLLLLPLTVSTDWARSIYCYELKIKRKISRIDFRGYFREFRLTGVLNRAAGIFF